MKLVMVAALVAGCGGSAKPVEQSVPPPEKSESEVMAEGFNEEGVKAMYSGKYDLASEHFRNAVARMPDAKYFFNLCTSLFQEGKLSEAKTACAGVDLHGPPPALAEKAHALSAKIDAEAAAQNVSLVAETGVKPARTDGTQAQLAAKLSEEGVELMYAQKYAEASSKFRDAVARVPEPTYFFNLCTSLFQEGKFSEALTSCNAVQRNHPTPALQTKANKMIERINAEAKAQGISL